MTLSAKFDAQRIKVAEFIGDESSIMSVAPDRPRKNNARSMFLASASACILATSFSVDIANAQQGARGGTQAPLSFKTNYFGYAASVSPTVTYSDNNNLGQDGNRDGAVIGSVNFNGSGIYSNRRFTGLIDGDLGVSYISDDEDVVVNQRLGATGTATVAENLAYIDISGSTNRQLVGDNAAFSRNVNAARGARANVHSLSVSPYFNRQLDQEATAEIRYRFSQVFVDDDDSALNDSRTHEIRAAYDSGEVFDRLSLSVFGYAGFNDEFGSVAVENFGFEQFAGGAEVEYAVSSRFALTGAVGYDEIQSDAPAALIPEDDLSGVFWRSGFRARPGRKTNLRLEYGRRFGDGFVSGDFSYDISRRFQFRANAGRDFRTRTQTNATRFTSLQRSTLEFADRLREGNIELSPASIINSSSNINRRFGGAQTIGVAATNRASAALIGSFRRTQVSANANYVDDDFNFRQVETAGGGLAVNHQLSRRISAYGDVFYRRADTAIDLDSCIANPEFFGLVSGSLLTGPQFCTNIALTNGVSNTVGGRIGAQYRVFKNVSAFAEYSHTERFSENPLLEFSENLVTAGLTYTF